MHLNGHFDVVPAGAGWTVDPFGGVVRDGRIYGRGACDMKAGIAAAVFAVEAIRRAGVELEGTVEISGTVDEESGGFAGVAWLAQDKRVSSSRNDCVIIPEPLNVDRICIGHRGVYWFEVETFGRIGHGSMPFLGVSAIEHMGVILERMRRDLLPPLAARTTDVPVVPDGARHATLNINGIVRRAARRRHPDAVRRGSLPRGLRPALPARRGLRRDEGGDRRAAASAPRPRRRELRYDLRDLMVVHPVRTPDGFAGRAIGARASIERVLGRQAAQVASPGTYDHKHFDRIAGIRDCVAYGPGILDLAHQPDEWCGIDDLVNATKVLALAILELTGARSALGA